MSTPAPTLQVDNVTVTLGGVAVVKDVSFILYETDLALLSGPNGAGKSTLLRAIVYLLPFAGNITVSGHHPASLEARGSFAFVSDEAALYEDLTLHEHIEFTARLYAQPDAEARMRSWAERFNLGDRLDEFPGTHSRGMRQKLALSLALGLKMPLLVLDEPFNGLDTEAQGLLVEALRERAAEGGTVLLTAHQGDLRAALGALLLELRSGVLQTVHVAAHE